MSSIKGNKIVSKGSARKYNQWGLRINAFQ